MAERLRDASVNTSSGNAAEASLGEYAPLIEGGFARTGDAIDVLNPYDSSLVAVVHRASPQELEAAMDAAQKAFDHTRKMPAWERSQILQRISDGIEARHEELARTIALEAGKPIRTARAEVDRAAFTFKVASEEARRIYGEIVPLDWLPGNEGRVAHVHRVSLGPVLGISPFNFPLNLVAHKVAPALAAGNPILLRPASQTPVSSFKLAELVLEAGWPEEAIAVLPSSTEDAAILVEDERIKKLTFTGSPAVGWALKNTAGRKRITLELGGNAGTIVHKDADIAFAAQRLTFGGFSYAGQSCISVQRVFVHQDIFESLMEAFLPAVSQLVVGNPLDEATDIGPLIDRGAVERVERWIGEAIEGGAELLAGGERDGSLIQPTVLGSLSRDMKVSCEEVFGPVVGVVSYTDIDQAIREVDEGDFGLQAGLFTHDQRVIQQAFDAIEVGGLMINDVSTYRIDHMPYGGVKLSGEGREGLRYAIQEMTEMKLMTINHAAG